ncbi:MAG TPA: L,D-transpeptidase [Thermoanaerobaculia bacterium]
MSGKIPEQSGIFAVRTGFLRITQQFRRPRKIFRPSWAVNGSLLVIAAALAVGAGLHRRSVEGRFAATVRESAGLPTEIKKARQALVDLEADEKTLGAALDARMKYAQSLGSEDFYLVLDTVHRKFLFQNGKKVVRESTAEPGPARAIEVGKKRWTFPMLSGAFSIREKLENADWKPPAWVYAMNGVRPPDALPSVPSGLGRYVLVLSGGEAVVHSPPPPESPLKGPKPGSVEVPEADLAAIWKRIGPRTRVYVFGPDETRPPETQTADASPAKKPPLAPHGQREKARKTK